MARVCRGSTMMTPSWMNLLLFAATADATFWTVTSRLGCSVETRSAGETRTSTFRIRPEATPTLPPISSTTTILGRSDVTYVYVYYPDGAVDDDVIINNTTVSHKDEIRETGYHMEVAYTAPASCPTPFAVTATHAVSIPHDVRTQLSPVSTSVSVASYLADPAEWVTHINLLLPPGVAPYPTTNDFIYSRYIASCSALSVRSSYGSGDTSSTIDQELCSLLAGCTNFRTWVIAVGVAIPSLFVLGFLESWLWYRRLMTGRAALRLGTLCWIIISIWILCFTRRQEARGPADQARLRAQWKEMAAGERWKNWWRWGFRYAYPVVLLGDPKVAAPNTAYAGRSRTVMEDVQPEKPEPKGS